jgi:hypothetical protein
MLPSPRPHAAGIPTPRRSSCPPASEVLLTGDTAAKVRAAALAKVSGTVERVETNVDNGTPCEAHIKKSDGTEVEVQVDSSFNVTAVNTMGHP